ncbi:hypothetical protein [Bradyrhizobium prioriisuperbiae]|uniref:hypothetical protein n=1 Tax=Bradyrhizobium prioriisuperbiae TaxID=2854389 RepID=UPI0028EC317A|nr:hypothetical protein [Bradyrhizobium prioritasuperba]
MMVGFPLLLIPLAIINILVFLMPGVSFTDAIVSVPLPSQAVWKVTFGDALIAFSMLLLLFEVIKAARPGGKYFTDQFLALLIFAGAVAEFVLLPQFATSVFFLLTVLMLVDFLAGLSLRLRSETRRAAAAAKAARKAPPPAAAAPQEHVEPVVPSAVPPMATIEPARPAPAPAVTPSPQLQPGAPTIPPQDLPSR